MGVGVPLLLVVGGLLSVQAAANVQLGRAVRSPVGAAAVQLAVASLLLLLATVAVGATSAFGLLPDVPVWHLLGGIGSAVYITAGILLFPRLGAVVAVGLFIAGQTLTSLLLDWFGLLGVPAVTPGGVDLLGVLAVLAGAALIVRSHGAVPVVVAAGSRGTGGRRPSDGPGAAPPDGAGSDGTGGATARLGWWAVGIVAGAVLPVQGAINAQLRADLDAPLPVAAVSFVLATTVLAVPLGVAVRTGRVERPRWSGLRDVPWWGWLGGAVGAGYVTAVFLLIPEIGAAPTIALTVAGQQLAGAAVDHFGLLALPRRPVRRARLLGMAVLLAGVGLLQL
jgi:bacterial/archaeal transporter family-2 protein